VEELSKEKLELQKLADDDETFELKVRNPNGEKNLNL